MRHECLDVGFQDDMDEGGSGRSTYNFRMARFARQSYSSLRI